MVWPNILEYVNNVLYVDKLFPELSGDERLYQFERHTRHCAWMHYIYTFQVLLKPIQMQNVSQ